MNVKYAVIGEGSQIWYLELGDVPRVVDYYINQFEIEGIVKKVILHNESGPAFINPSGYKQYRLFGKVCRFDGPAVTDYFGWKKYSFGEGYLTFEKWFEQLTYEEKIIALYNPENFDGHSY